MIHTFTLEEYSWLSNMTLVNIPLKGIIYPSVEHAYMSEKSHDKSWKQLCSQKNISGKQIKNFSKTIELRSDWENVKLLVMEYCLREKFKQEPFKSKLIATGNENIQEGNYWGDVFYGVDLKQTPNIGENHLGRLIMKIRDEITNAV